VNLNNSPSDIAGFNDLPVKTVNGTVIYMRDVAYVHDGSPPQTNVVHVEMTLGGLALAVGILVDDGTVTIENINWHLEQGKEIETAILDGAQQIVIPATVSLMCISIAFVPMFGLGGVAGYLFRPSYELGRGPDAGRADYAALFHHRLHFT
jgi:multidrug efflux pump subunit AcrB